VNIVYLKIENLKALENNAGEHSNEQIEQIKNSIKVFGFTEPVQVTEDLTILSGHARVKAAQEMGWDTVPAVIHMFERCNLTGFALAASKLV
jgi:ParB-like chromosome segregation protein Spo0J